MSKESNSNACLNTKTVVGRGKSLEGRVKSSGMLLIVASCEPFLCGIAIYLYLVILLELVIADSSISAIFILVFYSYIDSSQI